MMGHYGPELRQGPGMDQENIESVLKREGLCLSTSMSLVSAQSAAPFRAWKRSGHIFRIRGSNYTCDKKVIAVLHSFKKLTCNYTPQYT